MVYKHFRKRSELMEETLKSRESRLKEENDFMSSQNMAKLKMVEQEKSDQVAAHIKRQEEWERNKVEEMDRIREQHRYDIW